MIELPDIEMKSTTHQVFFGHASNMQFVKSGSVDLVVTSPPYPMIEMWDFIVQLNEENPRATFEEWHVLLDSVWNEVWRVTKDGGFICVNIGDATRTVKKKFAIYPNHSRIIDFFVSKGATMLPSIIWQKPTNAPNKFMGSGMLPAGAYVTLEHEHILIFRKGCKREFNSKKEKLLRQQSAFFWEERNIWFSDAWDLKGVSQRIKNVNRERNAAFPFELPFRLINMFSLVGDTILDPFLGTGTTMIAAIALGRNSVGYELDTSFLPSITQKIKDSESDMKLVNHHRLDQHDLFVKTYEERGKILKHYNKNHNRKVMTSQEVNIRFPLLDSISIENGVINAIYR